MLVHIWQYYKRGIEIIEVIDNMLEYMKSRERSKLISTELPITDSELCVVVVSIISWLRLEYKRSKWILEGKHTKLKPLKMEGEYSWCVHGRELIKKEKQFRNCFVVQNEEVTFSENVSEEERRCIREKVFNNYTPTVHVLRRYNRE